MNRETLIDTIYDNINTLKRGLFSQMQGAQTGIRLSTSQLEVAFAIKHLQPIGVGQLAQNLYLTAGAVSQVAEALVQLGIVERTVDSTDRRKQTLNLTRLGVNKLRSIHLQRQSVFKELMSTMSDDDLRAWMNTQQKLIDRLMLVDKTNLKGIGTH